MAYVTGNPPTKKELKRRVADGEIVRVFSPGMFPAKENGTEYIEGPQYPKAHSWYAQVRVEDGIVTKVLG